MVITTDGKFVQCDYPGCENTRKNHKWGAIKSEDWFEQKDGKAFCPDHIPSWVEAWRKKKNANKD